MTFSVALVLFAALLHAVWNALVKSGKNKVLAMAMVGLGTAVTAAFFLPFTPFPRPESWNCLFSSVLLHLGYGLSLAFAYREGALNRVYPVARGTGPLIVACASGPLIAEELSLSTWLGVFFVSAGILILGYGKGDGSERRKRAILFAVITGAFIAGYTVVDGLGVRSAGESIRYITWLFFFDGLTLGTVTFLWYRRRAFRFARLYWRQGLGGGILSFAAYGIVLWAMTLNKIALIASLRETSVIFAAVIGTVFLKEPFGRVRILAAALVGTGVIMLQLNF